VISQKTMSATPSAELQELLKEWKVELAGVRRLSQALELQRAKERAVHKKILATYKHQWQICNYTYYPGSKEPSMKCCEICGITECV
jgi:hypothetical protein